MVELDFIKKSIDDAIIKCRTGGSLSNNVKSALNEFHDKSKKWKTEKGILINPNGDVVKEIKNGTESQLKFSNTDIEQVVSEHGGDLSIDHNHPTPFVNSGATQKDYPTCLSEADMLRLMDIYRVNGELVTPFKSITAECGNGSRMTLNRKGVDDKNIVLNEVPDDYMSGNMIAFGQDYTLPTTYALREKFDTASANLRSNYEKFVLDEVYDATHNYMNKWGEDYDKEHGINGFDSNKISEMQEKIRLYDNVKEEFIKGYVRENYGKFLSENIKEFNSLGFELTVEWL